MPEMFLRTKKNKNNDNNKKSSSEHNDFLQIMIQIISINLAKTGSLIRASLQSQKKRPNISIILDEYRYLNGLFPIVNKPQV